MCNIRRELKSVRKQWKECAEHEKEGLKAIRDDLRKQLHSLRTAERNRQKRRRRAKARSQFIKSPYNYVKKLLGNPKGGQLESEIPDVEQHLADAHNDEDSHTELDECSALISPSEPTIQFKTNEIQMEEVREAVQRARARSAPGYSGTSYKVYKKCPKLLKRLWKLVNAVWKKEAIPECWQRAEGCFVPKEEHSTYIKQFRTISLLSVECKIFFSVVSKRLTN